MRKQQMEFAAFIGLDWADTKHDYCLKTQQSDDLEFGQIVHTPEAIDEWARALQKRFSNQPVAICLELKTGPIVYALVKYHFITLFPIEPKALANYREIFTQSGAKDDPSDARLQLEFLYIHGDALNRLESDNEETRILQHLVEDRRMLVGEKVELSNRITAALKACFPQALQWFEAIDTTLFCDFIHQWPTLDKVKRARSLTLEAFLLHTTLCVLLSLNAV